MGSMERIPGFQVAPNQPPHTRVFDLTRQQVHQQIVVDPVEEFLQVQFHAPAIARRHMGAGHFDGLVRAAPRTKAVAEVREQRFEKRRQLLQQRLLDQAIQHAGYPQRSDPAIGLGNVHRTDAVRLVFTRLQPLPQGRPILLQVAREFVHRQAIGPRCAPVVHHPSIRTPQVRRRQHPLHQRVRLRFRPRYRRHRCLRTVSRHARIPSTMPGNSLPLGGSFCGSTSHETPTPTGGMTCSALGDVVARHLLRPRLTSARPSRRLSTPGSPAANMQISQGNSRDLPAYAWRIYVVACRASTGL